MHAKQSGSRPGPWNSCLGLAVGTCDKTSVKYPGHTKTEVLDPRRCVFESPNRMPRSATAKPPAPTLPPTLWTRLWRDTVPFTHVHYTTTGKVEVDTPGSYESVLVSSIPKSVDLRHSRHRTRGGAGAGGHPSVGESQEVSVRPPRVPSPSRRAPHTLPLPSQDPRLHHVHPITDHVRAETQSHPTRDHVRGETQSCPTRDHVRVRESVPPHQGLCPDCNGGGTLCPWSGT